MPIIGPPNDDLEPFEASLSGTQFSYMAPAHNHPRAPASKVDRKQVNLYDAGQLDKCPSSRTYEVPFYALSYKHWMFSERRYLLLSSDFAQTDFESRVFHLPEFSSLFAAHNFECAVERFIFSYWRSFASSGQCRLNWRVKNYNGTPWVAFENDGRLAHRGNYIPFHSLLQSFYITPITDQHVLVMSFNQVTRRDDVKGIDDAFEELREKVMTSTSLQLSTDAAAQKAQVIQNSGQQHYSESLPPYAFNLSEYPTRDIARDNFEQQHDRQYLIDLPEDEYSNKIDQQEKESIAQYKEQLACILDSHLRFKNT